MEGRLIAPIRRGCGGQSVPGGCEGKDAITLMAFSTEDLEKLFRYSKKGDPLVPSPAPLDRYHGDAGTPAHLAIAGGTGPRRIHSPARGRSLSVYPILFLYCHHVELTLKNLILAGRSSEEHRARRRSTSKVRSIPQEHDDLLKRFLQATGKGEMAGMVALLSKDAALHSDGGGRATALPNLIHGADSIPRAIVHGLRKLVPMERVNRIVQIFRASAILDFMGSCFDLLNHFNWVREQSYSSQAVHLGLQVSHS